MAKFQDLEDAGKVIADHLEIYRKDPDAGHDYFAGGHPIIALLLSAKGRKSGTVRTLPLIYKKIGDAYVIVASKGGLPDHPMWYKNLVANPDCEIQVRREHIKVRARTAAGDERQRLWEEMAEAYPPYKEYQKRTTREIPVVVLEQRD